MAVLCPLHQPVTGTRKTEPSSALLALRASSEAFSQAEVLAPVAHPTEHLQPLSQEVFSKQPRTEPALCSDSCPLNPGMPFYFPHDNKRVVTLS